MVYQLELSINLNKVTNLTEIKNILIKKAKECKLENYYTMYEHEGKNRLNIRTHCILTCFFIENDELFTQVDIVNQLKKLPYVRKPSDFQKGLDDAISKIIDKGTAAEWIIFRKGVIKVLKGAKKFKFSHVSQGGVRI